MSIADKITTLKNEVQSAYTSIQTKGGTIPSSKNTENLANAILSIPESASDLYMHNILFQISSYIQAGNMLIVSTNKDPMTVTEIAAWLYSKGFTSGTTSYPTWGSGKQQGIYEFSSSSTSTKTKYTISPEFPTGVFSSNGTDLSFKVIQSAVFQVSSVKDNVIKIS